jgi:hypothetical protein
MGRISDAFLPAITRFVMEHEIPVVSFGKGQR